ncbi:MAG: hypothetical protein IIC52_06320 [Proteobacteria bacterium]|nr:hypothetical protein [Pseudomonadota bacterium]
MTSSIPRGRRLSCCRGSRRRPPISSNGRNATASPCSPPESTQVAALKALGVARFVGYTPFAGELAEAFRQYFTDAGFEVLAMGKPIDDADDVYNLTTEQIRDRIIAAYRTVPGDSQALYILGSGWRVLDVIEDLEAALGVPVLHPVVVRCWYILTQLGRGQGRAGHGRLLAAMPPFAA